MSYPDPDDFDDGTYLLISAGMVLALALFWAIVGVM